MPPIETGNRPLPPKCADCGSVKVERYRERPHPAVPDAFISQPTGEYYCYNCTKPNPLIGKVLLRVPR